MNHCSVSACIPTKQGHIFAAAANKLQVFWQRNTHHIDGKVTLRQLLQRFVFPFAKQQKEHNDNQESDNHR